MVVWLKVNVRYIEMGNEKEVDFFFFFYLKSVVVYICYWFFYISFNIEVRCRCWIF